MGEKNFPLRIRENDKVEKGMLEAVKIKETKDPPKGLQSMKPPVENLDNTPDNTLLAQAFLLTNNGKLQDGGEIAPREQRTIGSKNTKRAENITDHRQPSYTSQASRTHDLQEERNKHQKIPDTKKIVGNKPARDMKADLNHEGALTRRVLPELSSEGGERDASDLSFLGAGESLHMHDLKDGQDISSASSGTISRKRTADGSLKSKQAGPIAVAPVLSGSVSPNFSGADCEGPRNAKLSSPRNVDGPGKSWGSTKSALGWLSRKLTGRPLNQSEVSKIRESQEQSSQNSEFKTFEIRSRPCHLTGRESFHRHASRVPTIPATSSVRQSVSSNASDDTHGEKLATSPRSLSDFTAQSTGGRLSVQVTPSSANKPSQFDDNSDKGTSLFKQSGITRAHQHHHPTSVTTNLAKPTKKSQTTNFSGHSAIEPCQETVSNQQSSPSPQHYQVSIMPTHPGTKGRLSERRNQKSSSIAKSTRSSHRGIQHKISEGPAPRKEPLSSPSRSVPIGSRIATRKAQGYAVQSQPDSHCRKQAFLALLDPIYKFDGSTGDIRSNRFPNISSVKIRTEFTGRGNNMMRPYLNSGQRASLIEDTSGGILANRKRKVREGVVFHTDFTEREIEAVERIICRMLGLNNVLHATTQAKDRLSSRLNQLSNDQQRRILRDIQHSRQFRNRDSNALLKFLNDATAGDLPEQPMFLQLTAPANQSPPEFFDRGSVSTLIRLRELGSGRVRRGKSSMKGLNQEINAGTCEQLKPWRSYTGASNDIMVVAWSPDGNKHAAGASAESSRHNMQYNRRNNLLLGDVESNTLVELPDHRINRPLPSAIADGPNSLQATYDACDPMLYITLTGVQFSATGHRLYTSSYDHTVKVWDLSKSSQTRCIATLQHEDEVELIALSNQYHNVLTTGTRILENAIRIYDIKADNDDVSLSHYITLCSPRAMRYPQKELYPSSLRWGISPQVHDYLLAGFSPRPKDEELETDDPPPDGDLRLWDFYTGKPIEVEVSPCSQNIFDCVWHPTSPIFATGSTCGGGIVDRSTRSVVRVYQPTYQRGMIVEYECPALDMNDVTFCPNDTNYITAGCTDGVTYVWDFRRPDKVLHKLEHGLPITPLKPGLTREQSDMGVRMALWGKSGNIFYSGSSDGVIKAWNINYSPEDVHLHDIVQLQAGVMCGAFSPDHSNLLVGDSRGAVHILSSAPISTAERVEEIRLQRSSQVDAEDQPQSGLNQNTEMADAARALLDSGELKMHPIYGAGKGPNYKGPYARYARAPGVDPTHNLLLRPEIQAQQLSSKQKSLAGLTTLLTRAERKNRRLQRDLAKVRNTIQVEPVHKDSGAAGRRTNWRVTGGEMSGMNGRSRGKVRKEIQLHHTSDDDSEIAFEDLPETSEEEEEEVVGEEVERDYMGDYIMISDSD
ncbi:MAG: hypothetical protein M1812_002439 [Candelaria pacifica]|nr:MAG: hypothetical protein M1812_002439 [Candelaria pacifica]